MNRQNPAKIKFPNAALVEEMLDSAIEMTFPASDPVAVPVNRSLRARQNESAPAKQDHQNAGVVHSATKN